ncbi:MAG: hypothetical protein C0467_13590 [Planctomycetaceae bacterium]|nr:hypothetical protein [Planctomycetaceae bacterium]
MGWGLLPPKAVEMLRAAQYDPYAGRGAELMTASFIWSDETGGVPGNLPSVRALFGYRGSLQRGEPDESLREPWDQLLAACPEWVGFRPERCSPALRDELEREYAVLAEEFTRAAAGEAQTPNRSLGQPPRTPKLPDQS